MFLKILLNYILGYVNIRVEGFFIERFINICISKKILLWNMKREKSTILYANIGIQDYKKLKNIKVKKDKKELIRIVSSKDGNITIDKTGKLSGRGAYICDNIECLEKVIKNKRLEKVLERNISEEIYNELRGVIIDKAN